MANTANSFQAENRFDGGCPTVTDRARPAASGSHRSTSWDQLCGSRCTRIGITNSRPITAATNVTTRATTAKMVALAAYTTVRLGIAVSEVRIIPVEYSAVRVSAPRT